MNQIDLRPFVNSEVLRPGLKSAGRTLRRAGWLAVLAMLAPAIAGAQQYFDPGLFQKTIERKPPDYMARGAQLGGFLFSPGIELAVEANDNIYYQETGEFDDIIGHVRPWANLTSNWSRHALNVNGWADIARYDDFGSEDYEDWVLQLDGRVDVLRDSYFNYEAFYMHLHEDRRTPDSRFGVRPTEFDYPGIGFGYAHVFNRLSASLFFRQYDFDYDDNVNLDGDPISNLDRDRTTDDLSLRLEYQFQPGRSVFLSYATNDIEYDQSPDDNGYLRDSDGHEIRGGFDWNLTGILVGELYVTYTDQNYDDPRFTDVDGIGVGAGLTWTPTLLTLVNVRMEAGPQETTQPGTSGYYSQLYSLRVQHELKRNVLLHARASYTDNDYEHSAGLPDALDSTRVLRAGLGVTYLMNRNVYLSGGYVYETQDADESLYEYSANRFFLTLGLEF